MKEEIKSINDNLLVEKSKTGDPEAFEELVNRHSGIFIATVTRMMSNSRYRFEVDDFLREKEYFMWEACRTFDSTKNSKYSTWLHNITKWECLDRINKQIKKNNKIVIFEDFRLDISQEIDTIREISNDDKSTLEMDASELMSKKEDMNIILEYVKNLSDSASFAEVRASKILKLRLFHNLTWSEISKKAGVCIQQSINIYKKHTKKIKSIYINYGKYNHSSRTSC